MSRGVARGSRDPAAGPGEGNRDGENNNNAYNYGVQGRAFYFIEYSGAQRYLRWIPIDNGVATQLDTWNQASGGFTYSLSVATGTTDATRSAFERTYRQWLPAAGTAVNRRG